MLSQPVFDPPWVSFILRQLAIRATAFVLPAAFLSYKLLVTLNQNRGPGIPVPIYWCERCHRNPGAG